MPRIPPANESVFGHLAPPPCVRLQEKGLHQPACVPAHASRTTQPASNKLTRWLDRKVSSIGSEVTSMTCTKNGLWNTAASLLAVGLLSATLAAQPSSAARYDNQIQTAVSQRLAANKQFSDVKSSVEGGIVSVGGTGDLYSHKT